MIIILKLKNSVSKYHIFLPNVVSKPLEIDHKEIRAKQKQHNEHQNQLIRYHFLIGKRKTKEK